MNDGFSFVSDELMMVLDEKLKDHQSDHILSCEEYECVLQLSWKSSQYLLKYFAQNHEWLYQMPWQFIPYCSFCNISGGDGSKHKWLNYQ